MKNFGRVSVCGCISVYNKELNELPKTQMLQMGMLMSQLKMEGFIVNRWMERFNESFEQNKNWLREGKLKYKETVTQGFDNMFKAFAGMLKGENIGKAIVKV